MAAAVRADAHASPGAGGAYWSLNLYPQAGEGGGCFVAASRPAPTGRRPDPERAEREATRRARGKIRRYAASNRLNRLGTLTYAGAGCHDPQALRRDVAEFFRLLRGELGQRLPYLWVPEWHPGGHGLHVHFVVGRYVRQRLIRDVWGRGRVDIRLLGDLPVGSGTLEESRLAARYLSKYVSKNVGERRIAGLHRYEVAQGFQPEPILCTGSSADEVIGQASAHMRRSPSYQWRSSDQTGWQGPPAYWCAWSD